MSTPIIILIVIGALLAMAVIVLSFTVAGVIARNVVVLGLARAPRLLSQHPRLTRGIAVGASAASGGLAAWIVYLATFLFSDADLARSNVSLMIMVASMIALTIPTAVLRACRISQTAAVSMEPLGTEPVALLLRSFASDGTLEREAVGPIEILTEEEEIARILRGSTTGRFVALARPRQSFQEAGAERVDVGTGDWRDAVSQLVSRASVVVMRLANSEAVLWELDVVVKSGKLQQTLFLLPQVSTPEGMIEYLEVVLKACELPGHPVFPSELEPDTRFLWIDRERKVQMLKQASADVPLQVVLSPFLQRLGVKAPRTHLNIDNVVSTMAIMLGVAYCLVVLVWNRLT